MKLCTKCKLQKDINEFSKNKLNKDGLHQWCRSCNKNYKNIKRLDIIEKRKIYYQKNKEKVNKCSMNYRTTFNGRFQDYKNGAKQRNKSFELTIEQFIDLVKQPCHYCSRDNSNGIDRKDNTIGYILDNCLPCCKICNQAKMDRSYLEFKEWLINISNHFLNK